MRQFEGYSLTTPITIGDVHNLSKQVTRLPRGNIALLGTDRLGIPLEQLDIELTPRDDYAEGRRNSINKVGFYDATLYCSDIPLVTQPWAIKPYLTSRTAVKDITTMQAINSLNILKQFALLNQEALLISKMVRWLLLVILYRVYVAATA